MKSMRNVYIAGLALFAVFIWLRDVTWLDAASDTLPVIVALPLFVWLGRPWRWRQVPDPAPRLLTAGILLALGGTAVDCTLLLAVAWCALALAFCTAYTEEFPRRLLLLPLFGFPWIAQNADAIGWWFRYTGAAVTAFLFSLLGFSVQREGTFLMVQGMPLSVEPACAGLNALQAMLLAGVIVVFLKVPRGNLFWVAIAGLAPLAWLANTLRIFMLGVTGLSFGPEFAMGWFHRFGGWLVICVMFALCQGAIVCLARCLRRST